jgi:hypothetical protein
MKFQDQFFFKELKAHHFEFFFEKFCRINIQNVSIEDMNGFENASTV